MQFRKYLPKITPVGNDLTSIALHLIEHFDKTNLKAWHALSLLFNETKLPSGYTFLHKVLIATNDEMFDFLKDDCMPMTIVLLNLKNVLL